MDIYTVVSWEYISVAGTGEGIRYTVAPKPPEKWLRTLAGDFKNLKLPGGLHADAQPPQTFSVWGMTAEDVERVEPLLIGSVHWTNAEYERSRRMGTAQDPQYFEIGSDELTAAQACVQGSFQALPPLDEIPDQT